MQENQDLNARKSKTLCKRFQNTMQEIQNEKMKLKVKHCVLSFIRRSY